MRRRAPKFFGTRAYDNYDLAELAQLYRLDALLPDLGTGRALSRQSSTTRRWARRRRDLFADAQTMLKKIVDEKWLTARAVIGFWPANQRRTTIFWSMATRRGNSRSRPCTRCASRWRANRAGPIWRWPISSRPAGIADYIGGFVVTAGIGEEKAHQGVRGAKDDYSAILLSALADRLAEAFAERMHEKVRKEYWGYAAEEKLSNDDLIAEKYQRHPARAGLSRPARAQREGDAVQAAGCGSTRSASS